MGALQEAAIEIDELGFGALWVPESPGGRDVLTYAGVPLGTAPRIPVATGIAIIWVRDPTAAASAARTLAEAFPERFVLGLGVSHRSTAVLRGHEYATPLSAMRSYVESMRSAPYDGYPVDLPPVVLAALGPKMLRLSGEVTAGAHPFLAPVEHTAQAREILGPDALLAPELGVILTDDAEAARATARSFMERFLVWPNYRRHLERLGFDDGELADGGSDRLIDTVFAWGDEAAIRRRVDDHLAAGADHVAVQPIPAGDGDWLADTRRLAPALVG
jgi:probable F420-dependent oxidoreductase